MGFSYGVNEEKKWEAKGLCGLHEAQFLYAEGSFFFVFYHLVVRRGRGHERYTFIDGYAGYNQNAIGLGSVHKTAFTTPRGTFVWVVMPFGLCNAPATL